VNPGPLAAVAVCCAAPHPGGPSPPFSSPPLRYPIGTLRVPDFLAPGQRLKLTDFRYASPPAEGAPHFFLGRWRILSLGYFAAEVEGERRGASFLGHRLSLGAWGTNGEWQLAAAWRAPRFVISADGRSSQRPSGKEWVWGPTLQVLVTPDVELYGFLQADTFRPRGRTVTELGGGLTWQRGVWLEAGLQWTRDYRITAARDENRVDAGVATLVVQAERAEVTVFGLYEDTQGRFARTEGETGIRVRVPILPRLRLEGDAGGRFDEGAGALRHAYSGSLTWFGRRATLPRAGVAARRALALTRAAVAAGEYERRVFGDEELRAQRERLSLSGRAPQLREAMTEVYRAQVAERDVPLLGIGLRYEDDIFTGSEVHTLKALVGVPWPPAWPWAYRERSVPFLTLELEHAWVKTASHFRSANDRATLTVSLSREMDLVAGYTREEPTAQDIVLGRGVRSRFSLEYVYARGR
jgi:hypothetical protein